jgi:hypothetical protein
MFAWVPIYIELAEKLLAYRDRQDELLRMIDEMREAGLKPIKTEDEDKNEKPVALKEIDPFTFFANFNRTKTSEDQRRLLLEYLRPKFNLKTPLPEDFDGVPVVLSFNAWFFPWEGVRQSDDVSSLWALAKATVSGPPETLDATLFSRCLHIEQVGPPKLTMGMYWMNPKHYTALDKNNRELFARHQIPTKVEDLSSYLSLIRAVNEKLGSDYPKISRRAWEEANTQPRKKQYWAGGTYWSKFSKAEEFVAGNFWQIGWTREDTEPAAKKTWERFEDVNVGDEFAMKGLGGQYDLVVYYIGEVVDKTDDGILRLKKLDRPLYRDKAPSGPPWFDTLVPITAQRNIDLIFHGKQDESGKKQPDGEEEPKPLLDTAKPASQSFERPNLILYGPPGTGKTYETIERSVKIADPNFSASTHVAFKDKFDLLVRAERIAFITFHQSYSYEDFVEGIRPVLGDKGGQASYECRAGIFKRMAVNALFDCLEHVGTNPPAANEYSQRAQIVQDYLTHGERSNFRLKPESAWKPYVLIVDEINRGNMSKIFGELITLIETDKRVGPIDNHNSLVVKLPYSNDYFAVPPNLFLLATMNTADKSIALVDIALRRRFEFKELSVQFNICNGLTPQMRSALNEFNLRIRLRKDRDHQIGHAYFITVKDSESFNKTFRRQIIPLLQEYFYNDWNGLQYILGENVDSESNGRFIRKIPAGSGTDARNKWQWFFDIDGEELDCLQELSSNYFEQPKKVSE